MKHLSKRTNTVLILACFVFLAAFFAQLMIILLMHSYSDLIRFENPNIFAVIWITIVASSIILFVTLTSQAGK